MSHPRPQLILSINVACSESAVTLPRSPVLHAVSTQRNLQTNRAGKEPQDTRSLLGTITTLSLSGWGQTPGPGSAWGVQGTQRFCVCGGLRVDVCYLGSTVGYFYNPFPGDQMPLTASLLTGFTLTKHSSELAIQSPFSCKFCGL